jgi:hypothetical protein
MNQASGRGLVLAPEGYVAFEVIEGELTIGDAVDGDLMSHGFCDWINVTTGKAVRVYVQRIMASVETARTFTEARPGFPPTRE